MAVYYVGPGGNDGNSGLTWALRKLTLNGAEDVPVVAGDTVYVGPGVYREMLTCDVSGGAGTEIVYIADVTGEHTDGVGGIVRITGSDNDTTATRGSCITTAAVQRNYRTFRGFRMDMTTGNDIIRNDTGGTNWIIEDCFLDSPGAGRACINLTGVGDMAATIRRCLFLAEAGAGIGINRTHAATTTDTTTITNCIFINPATGIYDNRVDGFAVRNCLFFSRTGVRVATALAEGNNIDVNNCIFCYEGTALQATAVGEIVEDYNTFWGNSVDRSTVNVGANSLTYPPLFLPPILHAGASQVSGFKFPWWFGELSEWSQIRGLVGTGTSSVDLLGLPRSAIESKSSWGPIEFMDYERETGTTRSLSTASVVLHDAGVFHMWVPTDGETGTFSVYVYREADYSGTAPRMVIKQPGQSDRTTTDAGAVATWNQLSDTFAPAASPPYVLVELQSLNVNPSGNFDVFFEDLDAS